jgi:hypothetical protein
MPRAASRNDTALHRSVHRADHDTVRHGRLAYHLAMGGWRPLRALADLIDEVERRGCGVTPLVLLQAKTARDQGWPYLEDESGEIWK